MNKKFKNLALWLLMCLVAVMISQAIFVRRDPVETISVSQFLQLWDDREISSLEIVGESTVNGETKDGGKFTSIYPDAKALVEDIRNDPELAGSIEVTMKKEVAEVSWISIIPNIISIVLISVVFIFFINQLQGGSNKTMQFGKSRARLYSPEKGKITFADVAGVDEAKQELEEIVDFLKHPKRYGEIGAKMPKGIMLVGSPGTGKTLLARAVAGEAGVPFFTVSGSDFVEMFVGVGASRVRDMFEQAKRCVPCIVFVDEIDAVGRQRGTGLGGGHDEREQTLNQILVEMDGFESNIGLIVMAATNRPDVLDPALLRPGRFDRQITVDLPDVAGREAILKVHAKGKPISEDVDFKVIAKGTPGFTGADLANLLNEAALLTVRNNKKIVGQDEIQEAVERAYAGPSRKSRVMSEEERTLVSYHEAGHALVSCLIPGADPVLKVSIVPRGNAGGYTLMVPEDDIKYRYNTKTEILDNITIYLGGRVAEEVALHDISTGASNDLDRVAKLARKMVTEYGMSDLGALTYAVQHEETVFLGRDFSRERNYSEQVAAQIDEQIKSIVDRCHERARKLITDNIDKLKTLAETLKEKEVISGEEARCIVEGRTFIPPPTSEATA